MLAFFKTLLGAIPLLLELWPILRSIVERGQAHIVAQNIKRDAKKIEEIFLLEDKTTVQDISDFNDLFRK